MTSKPNLFETDVALAYLDANVLAKAVTRSILLIGAAYSDDLRVVWSETAETEADRHVRANAVPVARIRAVHGIELGPTGSDPHRFPATSRKDRQILSDAQACRATHLVTEDVDDFAIADIAAAGLHAAVNPDLFMSIHLTEHAYRSALYAICRGRTRYPSSPQELHSRIAANHPLLHAAMATALASRPVDNVLPPPASLFRGSRCLRCADPLESNPRYGLCPACTPDQVR